MWRGYGARRTCARAITLFCALFPRDHFATKYRLYASPCFVCTRIFGLHYGMARRASCDINFDMHTRTFLFMINPLCLRMLVSLHALRCCMPSLPACAGDGIFSNMAMPHVCAASLLFFCMHTVGRKNDIVCMSCAILLFPFCCVIAISGWHGGRRRKVVGVGRGCATYGTRHCSLRDACRKVVYTSLHAFTSTYFTHYRAGDGDRITRPLRYMSSSRQRWRDSARRQCFHAHSGLLLFVVLRAHDMFLYCALVCTIRVTTVSSVTRAGRTHYPLCCTPRRLRARTHAHSSLFSTPPVTFFA